MFNFNNVNAHDNSQVTVMREIQEARRVASELLRVDNVVCANVGDWEQMFMESGLLRRVDSFWPFNCDAVIESRNDMRIVAKHQNGNGIWVSTDYSVVFISYRSYHFHRNQYGYLFAASIDVLNNFVSSAVSDYRRNKRDQTLVFMSGTFETSMQFSDKNPTIHIDDVLMKESVKNEIVRSIDAFFNNRDMYTRYGIPHRRGILLYGKPGNGKTSIVKALSSQFNVPVAYWQVNENTSSQSLQFVFDQMKLLSPAILVIEDIDSLPTSMRSMFLNYLDGSSFDANGLLIIGTTNFPEQIDPALMNRAGRFDRAYEIEQPDYALRYQQLINKGLDDILDDNQIKSAARMMDGFSMSALNELYTHVVLQHVNGDEVDIESIVESMSSEAKKQRDEYTSRNQVGF